ncbi:MAG: hypothetical protein QOH36_1884 [Actinomycetota bacterium]|nr:hypothetical protein [Actinomycetota bacterium]
MILSRRFRRSTAALVALLALALALVGCGGGDGDGGSTPSAAGPTTLAPAGEGADRPIRAEEAWRWPAPPPGSVGMPAADDDGVSFTYGHLRVVLLDLDGSPRWEVERVGLRDVAPALTSDLVVAATEKGLLAVDRATGKLRWDTEVGERANTPVVVGGRAVVSTWEGSLTAFDLDDGRVAWRTALPGPAIGPAATDGSVVAATWESTYGDAAGAVVVEGGDGRQRWSVPFEPGGVGGPAIVDLPEGEGPGSVVVAVAGDIAAHALDLADGHERWRTATGGRGSPEVPPLPFGDGEVLVAHRRAGLVLLDAGTGAEEWFGAADGAAVRGGPAGPGPDGPFAFPIDDGRLFLVGPGLEPNPLDWPGRVSGVAITPDGLLLVATREARANYLIALALDTA